MESHERFACRPLPGHERNADFGQHFFHQPSRFRQGIVAVPMQNAGLRARMRRRKHVLGRSIIKMLAGGMNELAEALLRPCIEIVAGVDGKFACLAESRAAADACILREGRRHARNAISCSDVVRRIGAAHLVGECTVIGVRLDFGHWSEPPRRLMVVPGNSGCVLASLHSENVSFPVIGFWHVARLFQ